MSETFRPWKIDEPQFLPLVRGLSVVEADRDEQKGN
jgi:hypothetical protein